MGKKKLLLPGEHQRRSVVFAPISDEEGGALRGHMSYIVELRRLDQQWRAQIQWVDLDNQGHKVTLPHAVVATILRQADSVMAICRQQRAQRAAETRKHKATSAVDEAEDILTQS